MNVKLPGIENLFECGDSESVNTLIVESPKLLYEILVDIDLQFQGNEGKTVVSCNDKVLPIDKYLEVHSQFVSFSINQKNLINKMVSRLNEIAVDTDHFMKTSELISEIENYFMDLSIGLTGNVGFSKLSIESALKAAGAEFVDDYVLLSEKLLDYFELVKEYDRNKIFILINLRSFLQQDELQRFVNEILVRGFEILLIDSRDYPLLNNEKRCIVDDSLCEIC